MTMFTWTIPDDEPVPDSSYPVASGTADFRLIDDLGRRVGMLANIYKDERGVLRLRCHVTRDGHLFGPCSLAEQVAGVDSAKMVAEEKATRARYRYTRDKKSAGKYTEVP